MGQYLAWSLGDNLAHYLNARPADFVLSLEDARSGTRKQSIFTIIIVCQFKRKVVYEGIYVNAYILWLLWCLVQ